MKQKPFSETGKVLHCSHPFYSEACDDFWDSLKTYAPFQEKQKQGEKAEQENKNKQQKAKGKEESEKEQKEKKQQKVKGKEESEKEVDQTEEKLSIGKEKEEYEKHNPQKGKMENMKDKQGVKHKLVRCEPRARILTITNEGEKVPDETEDDLNKKFETHKCCGQDMEIDGIFLSATEKGKESIKVLPAFKGVSDSGEAADRKKNKAKAVRNAIEIFYRYIQFCLDNKLFD